MTARFGMPRRILGPTALAAALLGVPFPAPAVDQGGTGLIEPSGTFVDATRSWLEHGMGKLRAGSDDGAYSSYGQVRIAFDYRVHFTDTFSGLANVEGYGGNGSWAGVTEAYARYAPVPRSAWRYRARGGLFLPPLSLENTAPGWTTPYTLTPSLLNDWIGEELRALGGEFEVEHSGAQAASPSTFVLRLGVFEFNDTAGTLLAWRGWAANDRVTPWGRTLPLPDSPAFWPGGPFAGAAEHTDPFLEVDHRPGYYMTGEWRYRNRIAVLLAHYDNRADPTAFAHGQIGWRTRFDQLGMRWRATRSTELIAQYLTGDTLAGHKGSRYSVYADFKSWFVLASRTWGPHRLSLRFEKFRVSDQDSTLGDDNNENGRAWTAAYQYELRRGMYLGVQYMLVESDRPQRALVGLLPAISERQYRVAFRYFF